MSTTAIQLDMFYRHHHTWLLRLLHRKILDWAAAEDITQETFVRVCASARQMSEFLGDLHNPKGYLRRLAHGIYVDNVRRQLVEEAYLDTLHTQQAGAADASAEACCQAVELVLKLAMVLDGVSDTERQAFLWYRFSALSQQEIAVKLGMPLSTLKKQLARTLVQCHLVMGG